MVEYDIRKSGELFKASLSIDSEMDLVLRLAKESISVGDQIRTFTSETGKGRASYFRVKKKVLELVGGKINVKH